MSSFKLVPLLGKPDLVKKDNSKINEHFAAALPGSTVLSYNNSTKRKKEAASRNLGAKAIGATLGTAAGYGVYRASKGKLNILKKPSKFKVAGKKIDLSADKKAGFAASLATGTGGSIGGFYAGSRSQDRIKKNPRYGWQQ